MTRPRDLKFAREAMRFAQRCGYENVAIVRCRKHPTIRGTVGGRTVRVTFAGTPGDWRNRANTFADLRRAAREARS